MSTNRFTRHATLAAALAAGLVLAAPAAAQAHVGVTPDRVSPEGAAVLTFSFSHGCEDSDTTALRITMPDGLTSVSPTVDALWDVAVDRADNGLVSAVTYTATAPIPHDLRAEVTMAVRLGEDALESLAFPVEQRCETGVNEWVETAEEGQDPHDLDSPAPVVTVAETADGGSDAGHGDHAQTADPKADEAASDPAPTIGIALGAAGLLTGIAGIVIGIRATRRAVR